MINNYYYLYYIFVVGDFLSQLVFVFLLFLAMVMYSNEFKTKEKQTLTKIKNNCNICKDLLHRASVWAFPLKSVTMIHFD